MAGTETAQHVVSGVREAGKLYCEILRQAVYDLRIGDQGAREWVLDCSAEEFGFAWVCQRLCEHLPEPPGILSQPQKAAQEILSRWWIAPKKMTHRSNLKQPKRKG